MAVEQGEQTDGLSEVKVSDEFVALNSIGVLKCRASSMPEFSHLIEWFTSDGLRLGPSQWSKGKLVATMRCLRINYRALPGLD